MNTISHNKINNNNNNMIEYLEQYLEPNVQRHVGIIPPSVCQQLINLGEKCPFHVNIILLYIKLVTPELDCIYIVHHHNSMLIHYNPCPDVYIYVYLYFHVCSFAHTQTHSRIQRRRRIHRCIRTKRSNENFHTISINRYLPSRTWH
mmetsp:Transcript_7921/g.17195  ORF Transcript_7921/g.17195 Transcript_7921/m.17195 type:complete len:147 (-) Transcript_7921:68-508(-)